VAARIFLNAATIPKARPTKLGAMANSAKHRKTILMFGASSPHPSPCNYDVIQRKVQTTPASDATGLRLGGSQAIQMAFRW